jgi:NADPH-dependent 2,4-dienoyl-CoA reductase/sulfur reductase-like enzyme
MSDFLIIGADAAGLSASIQIKRKLPRASIKVINKGRIISYGACGIPYVLSGEIRSADNLIHFSPQKFREKMGIVVETKREAIDISPAEQVAVVKNLENGETYEEKYEKLLIATGAEVNRLPYLEGEDEGTFYLHNLEDLYRVLDFLKRKNPQKVAIIGAGNIGLELAEAMHTRGKSVLLFDILENPVATFPSSVQKAVIKKIGEKGIQFHGGTALKFVKRKGENFILQSDDREFESEAIFSVAGIKPATQFCGNKLQKLGNGALVTDRTGQTSDKNIYAAGDCAAVFHKILQRNVYFPLGTTANRMGRIAGLNMAGTPVTFPGIVGTQIFKFFELSLAKTGLNLQEALKEGLEAEVFSAQRRDKAGYYPGASKVRVDIFCQKDTGKILGAAVVCEGNAVQFIDPAAVAVFAGMRTKDLGWFDSAYTPPYAPVWNALVSAALKALKV